MTISGRWALYVDVGKLTKSIDQGERREAGFGWLTHAHLSIRVGQQTDEPSPPGWFSPAAVYPQPFSVCSFYFFDP